MEPVCVGEEEDGFFKLSDFVIHLVLLDVRLEVRQVATARLPWVAAMTYPGSSPISCATLPQVASTSNIESVRVPSYRRSVQLMKGAS